MHAAVAAPRALLITLLLLASLVITAAPAEASANNHIADAIDITSLPFTYNQTAHGDTVEANEPLGSCNIADEEGTSWYTYTPPATTTLGIETSPSYAFASVAVYTGGPVMTSLTQVACSRENFETFVATSGVTYWIQVASYPDFDVTALYADFAMGEIATIEGTVTHPVDGPVEDGEIDLFRAGKRYSSIDATTNASGFYSATVIEGAWNVRFQDPTNDVYAEEWFADASTQATATVANLAPGSTATADMSVSRGATMSGQLRDVVTGKVISTDGRAELKNVAEDSLTFSSEDQIDGSYEFTTPIPAGTYALSFRGDSPYGNNWSDGSFSDDVDIADAPHFVLAEDDDITQDILLSPMSIAGRVIDAKSGDPIKGITVGFYDDNEDLRDSVTTTSNGRFDWRPSSENDGYTRFSDPDGLYELQWFHDVATYAAADELYTTDGLRFGGINATMVPINVAPVIDDQTFTISDLEEVGVKVGTVEAADPNQADSLTYSITAGNNQGDLAINASTGKLTIAKALDATEKATYTLTVKVADDNAPSLTDKATITVEVSHVNTVAPSAGFTDADGTSFTRSIDWLAWVGITQGCNPPDNDEYCPDAYVTRGQMATFLTRGLELPATDAVYFTDSSTSPHRSAINRIAEAGITQGCNPPENDEYCPDAYVTRAQMATFLTRGLSLPTTSTDYFGDDSTSPHQSAINRLAESGITRGCNPPDNDEYCPNAYVTRGQMAAFLHRALEGTIYGP